MIGFSKSMLGLATISVALSVAKGTDLRGSATDVSAPKGKIGLYTTGGDFTTAVVATVGLSPFVWSPCAETLDWEIVHFGMTEEDPDGSFHCDGFGGEENCKFLEAMNCYQSTIPANITSAHAARLMVMLDTVGRTYPGMKNFLKHSEIAQVDKCMSSGKGKQLMHEAGVKTRKAITWDFTRTLDFGITFNEKQVKDFWLVDAYPKICELSGQPQCCHFEAHQQNQTKLQAQHMLELIEQRNVNLSKSKGQKHRDNYAIGGEKDAVVQQ